MKIFNDFDNNGILIMEKMKGYKWLYKIRPYNFNKK